LIGGESLESRTTVDFLKKYEVEVREIFQTVIDVMAYRPEEAIAEVEKQYSNGEIVLDDGDYLDHIIRIWE
jgi:beta-galactosidase beta subunit